MIYSFLFCFHFTNTTALTSHPNSFFCLRLHSEPLVDGNSGCSALIGHTPRPTDRPTDRERQHCSEGHTLRHYEDTNVPTEKRKIPEQKKTKKNSKERMVNKNTIAAQTSLYKAYHYIPLFAKLQSRRLLIFLSLQPVP